MTEHGRTQKWVAEQIGAHQTSVSDWLRGSVISLDAALAIRKLTGIPVEAWSSRPSHRPFKVA